MKPSMSLIAILLLIYPASCQDCVRTYPKQGNLEELSKNYSHCGHIQVSINESIGIRHAIAFENVQRLTLIGLVKPTLTCASEGGLLFIRIANLELRSLIIRHCGMIINSSNIDEAASKYYVSVFISASVNVTVVDVDVLNSNGVGMFIENCGGQRSLQSFPGYVQGKVAISNCTFRGNRIPENNTSKYARGGGLYIELKYYEALGRFELENCDFYYNNATIPYIQENNATLDNNGSGGGLRISVIESNIQLCIRHCNFHHNSAVRGGAIALVAQQNSILAVKCFQCRMKNNSSPLHGGGGVFLHYIPGLDPSIQSSISFRNCTFEQNKASFGGGLGIMGGLFNSTNQSIIHFLDCVFTQNKARFSAAVDIAHMRYLSLITPMNICFTDCTFTDNKIIDMTTPLLQDNALQVQPGVSTFTVLNLNVTFSRRVSFVRNTGTALYVITGIIHFDSGIVARFVDNRGYRAGAIALKASSVLSVQPNSSLFFIRNTAMRTRGAGAIFARSLDLHDKHCFLLECKDCQRNVKFYFSNNTAGHGKNAIFSDSITACHSPCKGEEPESLTHSLLSRFGSVWSCDLCEEPDCFLNCPSQNLLHVGGPVYRFEINESLPLSVFPGLNFNLSLKVFDERDNTISTSYYEAKIDSSSAAYLDADYLHVSNRFLQISGNKSTSTTLILTRLGFVDLRLHLKVLLESCPPGYVLNAKKGHCLCKDADGVPHYRGVFCSDTAFLLNGKWLGYVGKKNHPQNLYTTLCPTRYCSYNTTDYAAMYELPRDSSELEAFVCVPTRTGRVCGQCVANHSVYFHSPRFTCKRDDELCRLGWLWYILSELLPLTVVYVVVMVMNISFTSGSVNGFIFFAQVIDTFEVNANGLNGLNSQDKWVQFGNDAYLFIYNTFNLEFFGAESLSFCLWDRAGTLDVLVMKYVTMTYAFLLVVSTVFILNHLQLCCCRKASHHKYNIIHGLSAFFITCYVQLMRVSFRILLPTHVYGLNSSESHYSIVYYSGHLNYFEGKHLFYAIPALFCTVFMIILPPLALLLYPHYLKFFALCGWAESRPIKLFSVPFVKGKHFFDSFQSSYKNNFRFVAGLFFIYRMMILVSYIMSIGYDMFYLIIAAQLIVMILLHFLMQPHQNQSHNILDVLIFVNLSAINGLSLYRFGASYQHDHSSKKHVKVAGIVQLVLIFIPLAVVVISLIVKAVCVAKKTFLRCCSVRKLDDDVSSYDYRSIHLASFN